MHKNLYIYYLQSMIKYNKSGVKKLMNLSEIYYRGYAIYPKIKL